jgi:hypothetical protein
MHSPTYVRILSYAIRRSSSYGVIVQILDDSQQSTTLIKKRLGWGLHAGSSAFTARWGRRCREMKNANRHSRFSFEWFQYGMIEALEQLFASF